MGLIEVSAYTTPQRAAAIRARLMGKPVREAIEEAVEDLPPEPEIEIESPAPVFRAWDVPYDSHVYAWRVANYERQIKSLQMTIENKERAISRMIGDQDVPILPRVTASDVCKSVLARCAVDGHGNYTMAEILGPRRDRKVIKVRHHCVAAVVRKCPHLSYVQIGRFFNRDHTSILSAARKMGVDR